MLCFLLEDLSDIISDGVNRGLGGWKSAIFAVSREICRRRALTADRNAGNREMSESGRAVNAKTIVTGLATFRL
jgi:hypothetical protein